MTREKALEIIKEFINGTCLHIVDQKALETLIPELAESEDDRIRKELINFFSKGAEYDSSTNGIKDRNIIAWLEKQDETFTKKDVDDAYLKGICDAKRELEKQGDTNETVNRDKFAQGVLQGAAINLITWIDYNAAEGNMCLSNMECEDIEDALVSGNWDKIYAYIKKKLEKQSKQNSTDSYCQDNCKGFQETGKCFADGECKAKKEAEQNPAWSEEDEKILNRLISSLARIGASTRTDSTSVNYTFLKEIDWLKSLKPQPHWKPTEEQLMALRDAIDNNEMESLYNDLKKL